MFRNRLKKRPFQLCSIVVPLSFISLLFIGAAPAFAAPLENEAFTDINVSLDGQIMVVELDSPPINGISVAVLKGVNAALDIALEDENIRSMVVTGQEALFSGGAGEITDGPDGLSHAAYAIQTFNRMESAPIPIIAAVNGLVGQGGNEFAMATDLRILGDNAVVMQMEVQVGLIPGFGGMQRLPRMVGKGVAMEMMLAGRALNAVEAKTLGYAYKVTEPGKTLEEAIALANQLVEILGPVSLKVFKERFSAAQNEAFEEALNNDQVAFDQMFGTPEFQAAFEKFQRRMSSQQK